MAKAKNAAKKAAKKTVETVEKAAPAVTRGAYTKRGK